MNISGIGQGTGVLSSSSPAKFGDNPFLGLLVTQLRSQTPLEPMDNQSFMEQMAAFSSMEEQKELNDNMLKLLDYQGVLARLQGLSQSSAMLGKEVSYVDADGRDASGKVESVYIDDAGEVKLRVGDAEVSMRQVTGIREPGGGKDGSDGKDGKKS